MRAIVVTSCAQCEQPIARDAISGYFHLHDKTDACEPMAVGLDVMWFTDNFKRRLDEDAIPEMETMLI